MKLFTYPLLLSFSLFAFITDGPPISLSEEKPGEGIIFTYKGDDQQIKNAIAKAKEILATPGFYDGIRVKKNFTHTSEPASDIADALKKAKLTVRVRGYKGGDDTRTLAYVDGDFPTTIFINSSKTEDRKVLSITNTLIHETIHILDRSVPEARFGHGGNSSNGKKNSAPYWIGAYASKILSGDASTTTQNALALKNKVLSNPGDVVQESDLVHIEETELILDEMIDK